MGSEMCIRDSATTGEKYVAATIERGAGSKAMRLRVRSQQNGVVYEVILNGWSELPFAAAGSSESCPVILKINKLGDQPIEASATCDWI